MHFYGWFGFNSSILLLELFLLAVSSYIELSDFDKSSKVNIYVLIYGS